MWRPRKVGDIIAERVCEFRSRVGSTKTVTVSFGRPVHSPKERDDPWWCPLAIRGAGFDEFLPVAGEDSLQALTLALAYAEVALKREAKRKSGTLLLYGEPVGDSARQTGWLDAGASGT